MAIQPAMLENGIYLMTQKTFDFDVNIAGSRVGHPKSYYPPYKNITIEKGRI